MGVIIIAAVVIVIIIIIIINIWINQTIQLSPIPIQ